MITCLTYDSQKSELIQLKRHMKAWAAYATNDQWMWEFLTHAEKLKEQIYQYTILDLACIDITKPGIIKELEEIRRDYKETKVMLIADAAISPMTYLKPSLMPTSLLIRPAPEEKIKEVIQEFFQSYFDEIELDDKIFSLETREETRRIPYSKILYFEAREKKIFVRVESEEIAYYDTLENLKEILPDFFIRCHRSFIINKQLIKRIMLPQNEIELSYGCIVPVSRSYRAEVRSLG